MNVLSTMAKVVVQIAVVLIVPGGLPAVLIYQYRRLQKRRREALMRRPPESPDQTSIPDRTKSPR